MMEEEGCVGEMVPLTTAMSVDEAATHDITDRQTEETGVSVGDTPPSPVATSEASSDVDKSTGDIDNTENSVRPPAVEESISIVENSVTAEMQEQPVVVEAKPTENTAQNDNAVVVNSVEIEKEENCKLEESIEMTDCAAASNSESVEPMDVKSATEKTEESITENLTSVPNEDDKQSASSPKPAAVAISETLPTSISIETKAMSPKPAAEAGEKRATVTPGGQGQGQVTPRKSTAAPAGGDEAVDIGADAMLAVMCGVNEALVHLDRLKQGSKGACVMYEGRWLTPNEFQALSGRQTAKDWKRSIRHSGKTLKWLLKNGVLSLEPPLCRCDKCGGTLVVEAGTVAPIVKLPQRQNGDVTITPAKDENRLAAGEDGVTMEKKKKKKNASLKRLHSNDKMADGGDGEKRAKTGGGGDMLMPAKKVNGSLTGGDLALDSAKVKITNDRLTAENVGRHHVTRDADSKRASPLKSPDGSTNSSTSSSSSGGGKRQQPGISPAFSSRLPSSLPTAPFPGEVETANRRSTDSSPRYASAAGSREIEDGGERRRREDGEDKDDDSCSRTVGHSRKDGGGGGGVKRKSSLSSPSQVLPSGSQQPSQSRDHSHHHHQRHSPLTSSSSDRRSTSDTSDHEKRGDAAASSTTAASSDGDEIAMWRKWFPWLTATTSGVTVPQRVPAAIAAPLAMFSLPPTSSGSMPGPSSATSLTSTSGGQPAAPSSTGSSGGPFMHAPGERGGFCAPCPSSSPWVAHCTCYCAYFPHYPGTPTLAPRSPAGSTPSLPYPSPFGGYSLLPSPASMDGPGGPAYLQDAFRAAAAAAAASSSSYPWSLAGAYAGLLPSLGLASPSPFDLLARASMGDSHRVPSPSSSLSLPSPYTPPTFGLDAMFGKRLLAERPLDLSQRRF